MKWIRPADLPQAADALIEGEIVVVPTETVYGIASTLDPDALEKVFLAKGRPENKPLIIGVENQVMARTVASEWPEEAQRLATKFWPGPLSLVLPKASNVPHLVTGGGATVAIRAPAHSVTLELIRLIKRPIVLTSANRTDSPPPTTAAEAVAQLGLAPAFVIDAGATKIGVASTVYDVMSRKVLREGSISARELAGP